MIIRTGEEHKELIIRHRLEFYNERGRSEDDLQFIEQATRKFLDESWNLAPTTFLMMENNEVQGGCAVAYYKTFPKKQNPTGKEAYIINLFVRPQFRKKGVGTSLLKHILNSCKVEGIGRVAVHSDPIATRLFESVGFKKVDNYYRIVI